MILDITKLGEEILRKKAEPVAEVNDEIRKLADDMFETMIEANGVGLAAPQVGLSLRMFVAMADDDVRRVFINPQIIKTSEEGQKSLLQTIYIGGSMIQNLKPYTSI
jgi:peptide deformylase